VFMHQFDDIGPEPGEGFLADLEHPYEGPQLVDEPPHLGEGAQSVQRKAHHLPGHPFLVRQLDHDGSSSVVLGKSVRRPPAEWVFPPSLQKRDLGIGKESASARDVHQQGKGQE